MSQESRPTPAMADESPTPARIRRNTACVRCRDAKVSGAWWLRSSLPGFKNSCTNMTSPKKTSTVNRLLLTGTLQVKCNASLDPNRPCLRCSKSGLPCVFDRSHKRISGRRLAIPRTIVASGAIESFLTVRPASSEPHTLPIRQNSPMGCPAAKLEAGKGPMMISH